MVLHILLVDDSKTIQKVVELTLKEISGIELYLASDLQEGRHIIENNEISLYFVDVNLPDGNGYELARELKDRFHDAATVYLMWGTFESFEEEQAIESQCDGFFRKPFESDFFIHLVELAKEDRPLSVQQELTNQIIAAHAGKDQPETAPEAPVVEAEAAEPAGAGEAPAEISEEDMLFQAEDLAFEPEDADNGEDEFLFEDTDTEEDFAEDEVAEIGEISRESEPFSDYFDYQEQAVETEEKPVEKLPPDTEPVLQKDETIELDENELERIKKGEEAEQQVSPVRKDDSLVELEPVEEEEIREAEIEDLERQDADNLEEEPIIEAEEAEADAEEDVKQEFFEDIESQEIEEEEEILEISPMDQGEGADLAKGELLEKDMEVDKAEPTLEAYMEEQEKEEQETTGATKQEDVFEEVESSMEDTVEFSPEATRILKETAAEEMGDNMAILLEEINLLKRQTAELLTWKQSISTLPDTLRETAGSAIRDELEKLLAQRAETVLWEVLPDSIHNLLEKAVDSLDLEEKLSQALDQGFRQALMEHLTQSIISRIDFETIEEKTAQILEKMAWEVVPELSEIIIQKEVDKLKPEE